MGYYVESGGGQWAPALPKPLQYARKRRYMRRDDPLEGTLDEPLAMPEDLLATQQAPMQDLPGLPSTESGSSASPFQHHRHLEITRNVEERRSTPSSLPG